MNRMRRKSEVEPPMEPTLKNCPHCFTQISVKATKCPACTADLKSAVV